MLSDCFFGTGWIIRHLGSLGPCTASSRYIGKELVFWDRIWNSRDGMLGGVKFAMAHATLCFIVQ